TVGIHDDFFASGGYSLLGVQVEARVREGFGVEIPVGTIFAAPTPAAMAEQLAAVPSRQPLSALVPGLAAEPPPLSFAQARLWLLHQVLPPNVYNVPMVLRFTGPFDTAAWTRSLDEVRRRHEALRTVFRTGADGPVQIVEPFAPLSVPLIDLAGLEEA